MTFNVEQYAFEDRDGGGQQDDPKPDKEKDAVVAIIVQEKPDVLALQEMGSPPEFDEFRERLASAGLSYAHVEYQRRGRHENNMAILSRYPIVTRQSHMEDKYSIGEAKLNVTRGFLDVEIQVSDDYKFRMIAAHLKSKVFHQLGQTEMRRNEARLLNKYIRQAIKADPDVNLLVAGDMNDTYQSAAIHEVMGKRERLIFDLRPEDYVGDVWTHFSKGVDQYERLDYLFVNAGMIDERVVEKTHAVRHPLLNEASDHRPIVAVFRASDARTGD